jgi:5-methylcytosine-specific restriction endonuclease McrA
MAAPLPPRRKLTKLQRVRIFDGNGGKCHLCGLPIDGTREGWEADHVEARWKGGTDAIGNYRPAHIACHDVKSAAETTVRAKADAVRAKHIGVRTAPARPIQSAGFPKSVKAQKRAAATLSKLPLPAARSLFG